MEHKKDIGKAISDKLSTLDKTPRENVWIGISYELHKKKKRRIAFFFFWTRIIGLLLIGMITALYVYNQNDSFNTILSKDFKESDIENGKGGKTNPNSSDDKNTEINNTQSSLNNSFTTTDGDEIKDENKDPYSFKNKTNDKNNNTVTGRKNTINNKSKNSSVKTNRNININTATKISKTFKNKSGQFSKVSSRKPTKKGKRKSKTSIENSATTADASTQNEINKKQNNTTFFNPTSLQNNHSIDKTKEGNHKKTDSLIAKKDKEKKKNINMYPEGKKEEDSTNVFKKFYIDAFISPTYYGSFSKNSSLSRFLNSNSKTTEIEMNYGFGLIYELTEKIAIGIRYTNLKLNHTTHTAAVNTQNYNGIEYNLGITNATIYTVSNHAETMNITQKIFYNDISLEGRYNFLDKKIGLNGILGFSFLMLNHNSISIKTVNGFEQTIGKTKGLFNTAVSANIGFGADYQVFKNTKLFAEPMFNYQTSSFENGKFKPYSFGLHFGIRHALNIPKKNR